jgi:uncharacterized membrane protein YdjX (TVP38/TMEM64 family)
VWRYVKVALKVAFLATILLAMRYVFAQGYVSEKQIQRFVGETGILAVPVFILLLSLGVLTFAPFWVFVGTSTLAFGSTKGAVYSLLGIMIGACAAFFLGRYVVVDFARKQKLKGLRQIDRWMELNGLMLMIGLRFTFFANPILNYAVGQTSLKFRDYAFGSAIGCIPGVFLIPHIFSATLHSESLAEMVTYPIFYSFAFLRISGAVLLFVLYKSGTQGKLHPHDLGARGEVEVGRRANGE